MYGTLPAPGKVLSFLCARVTLTSLEGSRCSQGLSDALAIGIQSRVTSRFLLFLTFSFPPRMHQTHLSLQACPLLILLAYKLKVTGCLALGGWSQRLVIQMSSQVAQEGGGGCQNPIPKPRSLGYTQVSSIPSPLFSVPHSFLWGPHGSSIMSMAEHEGGQHFTRHHRGQVHRLGLHTLGTHPRRQRHTWCQCPQPGGDRRCYMKTLCQPGSVGSRRLPTRGCSHPADCYRHRHSGKQPKPCEDCRRTTPLPKD